MAMKTFKQFEEYTFSVRGITKCNDKYYFLLRYNNEDYMTEYYEKYQWVYRVPFLPLQEDAEVGEYIGKDMACLVTGFTRNPYGKETNFPILVQLEEPLLKQHYQLGRRYPFKVVKIAATEDNSPTEKKYTLQDSYGFTHVVTLRNKDWEIGKEVIMQVRDFAKTQLVLGEASTVSDLATVFKSGECYDFTILTEEYDSSNNLHFFTVRETTGKPGIHRFYFQEERAEAPGERIRLKVTGIDEQGVLLLEALPDSEGHVETLDAHAVKLAAADGLGEENLHREYKSSFVYSAKTHEPDIDYQLSKEIMKQLAGFMNADGGILYIGYRDDGTPCGIERDLPYINSSNEDEHNDYKLTADSLNLLFINTITRKLGAYACTLVTPKLVRHKGHFVFHLHVKPASELVFWGNERLYVRCHNSVQTFKGSELVKYVIEHYNRYNGKASAAAPVEPQKAAPAAQLKEGVSLTKEDWERIAAVQDDAENEGKVWRYITLYRDGMVSSQTKEIAGEDVFLNIPVGAAFKKKSSRLLLCYDNGCVNVLNPAAIIKEKLTKVGKRYANGFNRNGGCKLIAALVCDKEDYLVIRSTDSDGKKFIKAVALKEYSVHSPKSMDTQGNKFVSVDSVTPERYQTVKASMQSVIYPFITPPKRYGAGYSADAKYSREAVDMLDKL